MWLNQKLQVIVKRVNRPLLLMIIILSALVTLLERWILVRYAVNPSRDHYLSTTVLAIAVFLFSLLYISPAERFVSEIDKFDSLWIYILHPIFITILRMAMKWLGLEVVFSYIQPVLVFLVTTVAVDLVIRRRRIIERS